MRRMDRVLVDEFFGDCRMSGYVCCSLRVRSTRVACVAALLIAALGRVAYAEDPVMNERDINENSVTKALTPDSVSGDVVTRGFVLSNKQPGVAPRPASPARKPSAQMLITF